jgi:hypothetical protein
MPIQHGEIVANVAACPARVSSHGWDCLSRPRVAPDFGELLALADDSAGSAGRVVEYGLRQADGLSWEASERAQ